MNRSDTIAAVLAASLVLAGCSSIDGAPKPVIELRDAVAISPEFRIPALTKAVGDETDPVKAKRLRNRAIAVYMNAMDARYAEFRKLVSGEAKGWNAGLDISILGISSLGAVAKNSSNELAAFAAFLSGTRGSLNKELYFDRTLPALLAAMDGSRTRTRSILMQQMRDDITQYPMELALSDLAQYELSASIDGAIQQVTVDAVATSNAADETYRAAIASCYPAAALQPKLRQLNNYVYDLAAGADNGIPAAGSADDGKLERLMKISVEVGASPSVKPTTAAEADASAAGIIDATAAICSLDGLDALFARVKAVTGEDVR